MKSLGLVFGRSYPICKIEQSDIKGIKPFCEGFVHGGKIDGLESVLKDGKLSCSDILRDKKKPLARDSKTVGPAGQAVYFRFAFSSKLKTIPVQIFGPGSSGGLIYFMPADKAINQQVICFSSFDTGTSGEYSYKFSNTTERENGEVKALDHIAIEANFMKTAKESKKMFEDNSTNYSEIGFYQYVYLERIEWIFADYKEMKDKNIDQSVFEPHWKQLDKINTYLVYHNVLFPEVSSAPSTPSIPSKGAFAKKDDSG
jgi:hypothetical protein